MARKLQVALLIVGALAMMSLTYASALDEQTLVSGVGRSLLQPPEEPVKESKEVVKGKPEETAVSTAKTTASSSSCYDRAGYHVCKAWKHKGYCGAYTYKGWSVPYFWCQKTCYKCNKCVDLFPKTCKTWKYKGYCAPKYTYGGYSVYKVVCPKACGFCGWH